MAGLPLRHRLLAPEAGWTTEVDVVVVGSGIAGLTTALTVRRTTAGRVLLVTKTYLDAGSTRWAQGGIAAALGEGDTPEQHLEDTLVAGVGICDEAAVRVLVEEGPARVRELVEIGTKFDRTSGGGIALTREGGHHRDRIAHAGGDATGLEIERALIAALHAEDDIEVVEHALVLDLLRSAEGAVCGLTLHVIGTGQRDGVGAVRARAVVLATGGLGQVFSSTTNPSVSTGDGVAVALRAGAVVTDLEFVQFHPTVLWLGDGSRGQQPLVSEAVRGEGAVLRDQDGVAFMQGLHPMADLAPRDVVAKAIMNRMRETGAEHVWLDAREFGEDRWRVRFPTILASCREHGIDAVNDLIPVAPACHYASGGVRTDLHGCTSVPGLYACGEVACTGVHGANRLASNSLLEGLVFGRRIAEHLGRELPPQAEPVDLPATVDVQGAAEPLAPGLLGPSVRGEVARTMSQGVGVLRDRESVRTSMTDLTELRLRTSTEPCTEAWEATNLHLVASVVAGAALEREETRGSHWRQDFPDRDDEHWRAHLVTRLVDGTISMGAEEHD
jgi:L-aspartate oxidase